MHPHMLEPPHPEHAQVNQILPIGGPGKAYTAKEQGEILFRLTGRPQNFFPVPVALMDGIIGLLDFLSRFFPQQLEVSWAGWLMSFHALYNACDAWARNACCLVICKLVI